MYDSEYIYARSTRRPDARCKQPLYHAVDTPVERTSLLLKRVITRCFFFRILYFSFSPSLSLRAPPVFPFLTSEQRRIATADDRHGRAEVPHKRDKLNARVFIRSALFGEALSWNRNPRATSFFYLSLAFSLSLSLSRTHAHFISLFLS